MVGAVLFLRGVSVSLWLGVGVLIWLCRVPSIHVRTEFNVLLNPAYPQIAAWHALEHWPVPLCGQMRHLRANVVASPC